MKIVLLIVVCLCFFNVSLTAQQEDDDFQNSDTLTKVHNVIWFTPAVASEINGLAIGVLPMPLSPYKHLTINGVNIEIGVLPTLMLTFVTAMAIPALVIYPFYLIDNIGENDDYKKDSLYSCNAIPDTLTLNTIDQPLDSISKISTIEDSIKANEIQMPGTSIYGLNLSVGIAVSYNMSGASFNLYGANMYNSKGFCLSGILSGSKNLEGVQISGLANIARNGNGMMLSLVNYSDELNGFQIGLVNLNQNGSGLMIGLFNGSTHFKGVQIGLVNKINYLILPGINLSF